MNGDSDDEIRTRYSLNSRDIDSSVNTEIANSTVRSALAIKLPFSQYLFISRCVFSSQIPQISYTFY